MPLPNAAKFPLVNPKPTVDDCIKASRISDFFQLAGVTAASWGYGFIVGRPARFAMAGLMGGIGFTFGTLVVLQNTRGRLMGFRENSVEVAKYGEAEPSPVKSKLNYKQFN
jgi:NADH-ubiquinone oxidoreductase complex I, 21 kDa subunit